MKNPFLNRLGSSTKVIISRMSGNKKSNAAWAIVGAAIGGAIIGAIAGLFGSKAASDNREADLLDLRKRAQGETKK